MLLVLSQSTDLTTDKTIEWLRFYGFNNVFRINENDFIKIESISINNRSGVDFKLKINHKFISLSEISFFWFRRGNLHKKIQITDDLESNTTNQLKYFFEAEWNICKDFILNRLYELSSLGNFKETKANKLDNLYRASCCGFNIPHTLISDTKINIAEFIYKQQSITKPISEVYDIMSNSDYIDLSTKIIDINKLNGLADEIFPSLLQNNIDKWIELRVFIIYDHIFAMAMFSQNNEQTKVDYRNYDYNKINRRVPFQLPRKIKDKIFKFMNLCSLNTGSIDFILTKSREYIFLEINPAGNIEMISEWCNSYIEKDIAKIILNKINR
ncbi:MAG: grasp-with-spasm system ATP-grasp peptide maturase [Nitrososphaeraceae archaeon]